MFYASKIRRSDRRRARKLRELEVVSILFQETGFHFYQMDTRSLRLIIVPLSFGSSFYGQIRTLIT